MRRALRIVVLFFVIIPLLIAAAGGPLPISAQSTQDLKSSGQTGVLDLSAMLLTPLDLEDEGLEGYSYRAGGTDTLDDEFLGHFSSPDRTSEETEEIFEEAGLVQSRWVSLDLPSEEDPAFSARRVTIFIDEYTESGDLLSDALEVYLDYEGERLDGTGTIGDESGIAAYGGSTSDTDVETKAMSLAFRYENLTAQVEVVDFLTYSPDGEPEIEEVEALAERLLERIQTVREDGGPQLGTQALRFESDGEFVYHTADFYTRLDDNLLPRYGQDDDALDLQDEMEQEFGITDVYRLAQTIGSTGDTALFWNVTLRLFADEDDAADWVSSGDEWMEDLGAFDVDVIDDELDLGDGAMAISYRNGNDDQATDPHSVVIFVSLGDIAFTAQISYPGGMPHLDTVIELAEMQAECIEAGACPVESQLPDALIDLAESLD